MLSYVIVRPNIVEVMETSLSPPLTLDVPLTGPDVEPKATAALTVPETEPWAWKPGLVTLATKLSSSDIGVGVGVGVGVTVGVAERVVPARWLPQQAAGAATIKTRPIPSARRRTIRGEGILRFLTALDPLRQSEGSGVVV
jgi:hypothetical protein